MDARETLSGLKVAGRGNIAGLPQLHALLDLTGADNRGARWAICSIRPGLEESEKKKMNCSTYGAKRSHRKTLKYGPGENTSM